MHIRSLLAKMKPIVLPVLICGIVVVLFRVVFLLGYVPTTSMEPTIPAGSIIIGYRLYTELETGDVIIFSCANGRTLVKRIAAGPLELAPNGETVPENCYYLLGDNPESSIDSRYWDEPYIHQSQVVAVVLFP
ncbi:S24/S26 family peptidase [Bengtsoniella intestinalis]|uniref:S24/S26 family peptidase n=1 Tax=Bengtsoniella intestinalis TaxID=3073143 RepID=UPI00391F724B